MRLEIRQNVSKNRRTLSGRFKTDRSGQAEAASELEECDFNLMKFELEESDFHLMKFELEGCDFNPMKFDLEEFNEDRIELKSSSEEIQEPRGDDPGREETRPRQG